MRQRLIIYALVLIGLAAGSSYWLTHQPLPDLPAVSRPVIIKKEPVVVAPLPFNMQQYSLVDPSSRWVIVNKQRPLNPAAFAPSDLVTPSVSKRDGGMQVRAIINDSLNAMFAAAAANGTPLKLSSAYRSYGYQVNLYNGYVAKQGQASADLTSARPGYSEHQTGLAVDVAPLSGTCNLQECFGNTPAGQWVAANAYQFGFIIRYPAGLTPVTGYSYEPWHLRYVGNALAAEMNKNGVKTLEEFFALGAAPSY